MQLAAVRYGMTGTSTLAQKFQSSHVVGQADVTYFNVKKEIKVKADDHQVQSAHMWTSIIPGGIEAISSLAYPIDLQYRSSAMHPQQGPLYDEHNAHLRHVASSAGHFCQDHPHEAMRHILLILFSRFFKDSNRFMFDGAGIPTETSPNKYAMTGCHLMHGPYMAEIAEAPSGGVGGAQDIVILRPNIEHEMLGIIMGRGGTQELGATFWGQTELSCYDDAQHGKYQ